MKQLFLLIVSLFFIMMLQAQQSRTVELTAGSLGTELTAEELNNVTILTISGTMDARDFKTMRDQMPLLTEVDMSQATISAYEGTEGTVPDATNYLADVIPPYAFNNDTWIGKINFQSILIPLTTKVIGEGAFYRCSGLTSFSIPSSVTAIHELAFAVCYGLTSISIPESVGSIGSGAFASCLELTSLTIPSSVDSIQSSTFSSCFKLQTVQIPSSVTYIGNDAFNYCGSLESVTIPSSVTFIGDLAFYKCGSLVSITLSPGITAIGESAFADCTSLTGPVKLPEGLTSISNNTFENCSSLTSIVIPSSVHSIGYAAFIRCHSLETATLPSELVFIGEYAFAECINLSGTLWLPSSLATIGRNAFDGCNKLTGELIIPPIVRSIEASTFRYCTGLSSLTIPSSVTSIGAEAFYNCNSLTSIEVHHLFPLSLYAATNVFLGVDTATITLHVPFGTRERYAAAYGWEDFTTIIEGTRGFQLNSTALNFGVEGGSDTTVEVMSDFAWTATSDQPWLTVSPSSVENSQILSVTAEANQELGSRKGTITLTATDIPSQTIQVTQESTPLIIPVTPGSLSIALTREEKQALTSITLTGSMDARDFKTIRDQLPLLEVLDISGATIVAYTDTTFGNHILHPANAIPAAIYEWNDSPQTSYALSEHPNLAIVKLPVSLTSIGYRAFFVCSGLTAIDLQSSLTQIGNEAFWGCPLVSITLPPSVTHLGEKAFYWCSNLASIELSPALTAINGNTLAECKALTSIDIPASVTSIAGNAFTGCSELQSVVIPPLVTVIRLETFKDCSSLTSVTIPPSVTTIEGFAFYECSSLSTLILPESVTMIGPGAFRNCISLESIYCHAVNPPDLNNPEGSLVFNNVDKTSCLLYVPAGTRELYESAFEWKDFENILEMNILEVSETGVKLEAAQGSSASITISGNVLWTIGWDQPWLEVDPLTGTGNQTITIIADEANTSDTARLATVTVSAPRIETQIIVVTQSGLTTGVEEVAQNKPAFNCYPNPFTTVVGIEIYNPKQEKITVGIYNMAGQRIKILAIGNIAPKVTLTWDGTNEEGHQVPTGIYFCRVNQQTRQLVFGGK